MEILKRTRDIVGWQPSQNQAFFIIAGGMVLAGVLAWLV